MRGNQDDSLLAHPRILCTLDSTKKSRKCIALTSSSRHNSARPREAFGLSRFIWIIRNYSKLFGSVFVGGLAAQLKVLSAGGQGRG
jgi:hypothetical protein